MSLTRIHLERSMAKILLVSNNLSNNCNTTSRFLSLVERFVKDRSFVYNRSRIVRRYDRRKIDGLGITDN